MKIKIFKNIIFNRSRASRLCQFIDSLFTSMMKKITAVYWNMQGIYENVYICVAENNQMLMAVLVIYLFNRYFEKQVQNGAIS